MSYALLIVGHGSRDPEGIAEFLESGPAAPCAATRPSGRARLSRIRPADDPGRRWTDSRKQGARDNCPPAGRSDGCRPCQERHGQRSAGLPGNVIPGRDPHGPGSRRGCPSPPALLGSGTGSAGNPARAAPADTLTLAGRSRKQRPGRQCQCRQGGSFSPGGLLRPAGPPVPSPALPGRSLPDALPVCERMGFRRIVVQPYFLFTGVLLKRIYAPGGGTSPAATGSGIRRHAASPGAPAVVEAFVERAEEAIHGRAT